MYICLSLGVLTLLNLEKAQRSWAHWWGQELRPSEPQQRPGYRSSQQHEEPFLRGILSDKNYFNVTEMIMHYKKVSFLLVLFLPLSNMLVEEQLSSFFMQPTLLFLAA